MARGTKRDIYAYVPGFAVIVVLCAALALAPSLIPHGIRQALGLTPHRLVPARHVPLEGTFAFVSRQTGDHDKPVGYDPCKEIKVRVNPMGAPSDYRSLVTDALARAGDAAGLRLRYDGTTDARPHWDSTTRVPVLLGELRPSPVLISWADEAEVKQLQGDVAGIGGSLALPASSGREYFVTGGVTLDSEVYDHLEQLPDGRKQERAILLHELGHVLGLDHVQDKNELMYPSPVVLDYGPGDLAGLARVGDSPCA